MPSMALLQFAGLSGRHSCCAASGRSFPAPKRTIWEILHSKSQQPHGVYAVPRLSSLLDSAVISAAWHACAYLAYGDADSSFERFMLLTVCAPSSCPARVDVRPSPIDVRTNRFRVRARCATIGQRPKVSYCSASKGRGPAAFALCIARIRLRSPSKLCVGQLRIRD